jgi:hypothetical protein
MTTLITVIMFLLFTCMQFWVWEFYKCGPRVCRPMIKWSAIAEDLRNTALMYKTQRV